MLAKNSHYSGQPRNVDHNYLPNSIQDSKPKNYFSLKLSDLEDLYMSDYLNSEYDENDWEEEENDQEVDTFSDDGFKID